jgi:nicotinate phosphoribosyltransferase
VFSDSLDAPKAASLANHFHGRLGTAFGIGTNLTNDIGHKPLNMVIKATAFRVKGRLVDVVKLSDDPDKSSGKPHVIAAARETLGI